MRRRRVNSHLLHEAVGVACLGWLALLNRSGTGFFLVYNDRQDTSAFTSDETLSQSFVVKYTRLFDF